MFKRCFKNIAGFTLVELVVVVIIVGVLAGLAVANYGNIVDRTKVAEAKSILLNGYAGYQRLLFDNEPINAGNRLNWTRMGMDNPNSNPGRIFDYWIRPNNINPTSLEATLVKDNSKSVEVRLSDGCLTIINF
ncbi:MAG: prepilin-type N-terminal cleavage/methylation domain-containing protein [Candidatus Omnitrophota bacterium]